MYDVLVQVVLFLLRLHLQISISLDMYCVKKPDVKKVKKAEAGKIGKCGNKLSLMYNAETPLKRDKFQVPMTQWNNEE
ncbi:hypothetical protein RUM43_012234 [Polyplax serrata]|uniref:Uncharacterized protein n=1 Tax=Polyplax serrata TaxID=468196 RepID=A0AAN8P6S9_POLSC